MYSNDIGKIKLMQKERIVVMLKYLTSKKTKGDINKATSILYSTRTFACLKDIETDFYWKSEEELLYLLQQELMGNMSAWEHQAF